MKLGQVIKELREQRGMSAAELAQELGLPLVIIARIEGGKVPVNIPDELLERVSNLLEVPKEVILFKALEPSDFPEAKREAFKDLSPAINELLSQVF